MPLTIGTVATFALALLALAVAANLILGRLPKPPAAGGGVVPTAHGDIHYLESVGEGTPVIFIHGMPGLANEFDPVRASIDNRHMVAFDRPGYGWSDGRPQPFAGQIDALVDAARALGIERAVVVGHSFGGLAALGVAIRHPEFVDRMLLLAPAAGGCRINEQSIRQARLIKTLELPVIRQFADLLFYRILRRVASRRGAENSYGELDYPSRQRHLAESVLARHSSVRALANDRLIFNDAERYVTANLDHIAVPSVIVHGTDDATVPLRNGRRLDDALKNSTFKEIAGDHQLPAKNTEQVVSALFELVAL